MTLPVRLPATLSAKAAPGGSLPARTAQAAVVASPATPPPTATPKPPAAVGALADVLATAQARIRQRERAAAALREQQARNAFD